MALNLLNLSASLFKNLLLFKCIKPSKQQEKNVILKKPRRVCVYPLYAVFAQNVFFSQRNQTRYFVPNYIPSHPEQQYWIGYNPERCTNLTNQRVSCWCNPLLGGGIEMKYGWEIKQCEPYTPKQQGPEQRLPAANCCKISRITLKEKEIIK